MSSHSLYSRATGMDETFTLNYGECFIQINDPVTKNLRVIEGPVCNTVIFLPSN